MAASFIPKGQDGLLLRSPLTYGFFPHSSIQNPKPIYTKDWDKTYVLGQKHRQILTEPPQKLAFYTRNNPHPARVCHMKGLLDAPICCVEDFTEQRYLLSPPTGQHYESGFPLPPYRNTRYSANLNKGLPAIGVVPVTAMWRDELEKKTQKAILRAMGEATPPSRASLDSQMGTRKERYFDHLQDEKLLELLCQILQTDSVPACLAWLSTASETEKSIVLNMIKMASCGELQHFLTRPATSDSQFHYVWAPKRSQAEGGVNPRTTHGMENEELNFPYQSREWEEKVGGLADPAADAPFKLPENDTIVKTAHQLSRLASRNSTKAATEGGIKGLLTQEKFKEQPGEDINKLLAQKMSQHAGRNDRVKRQRSASLNLPSPNGQVGGQHSRGVKRARSRSVHSGGGVVTSRDTLPPIPVKVSVTKETIHGGSNGGSARLRYTSHWET